MDNTYTARDYTGQPFTVKIHGNVIASSVGHNVYLTKYGKKTYMVLYGLEFTSFRSLDRALEKFQHSLKHALTCEGYYDS